MEIDLIEYEKYLLKLMFVDKEAREKIYPFLDPKYFEDEFEHQRIIKQYINHRTEYGDYPTPREFINSIVNESTAETFKSIMDYDLSNISDEFVKDQASEFFKQKMILHHAMDMIESIKEHGADSVQEVPDEMRSSLSFSFDTNIGLDFFDAEARLYDSLHETDSVIATNIDSLNKMIKGGFHEKTLSLLIGGTNVGKTLAMCSFAADAVLNNKNVLYVTMEMSENKISERIMANLFDVNINELNQLSKEKFSSHYSKMKDNIKGRFLVKEFPTRGANTNSIRNLIKELRIKKGFVPDIVFVDYIGIMLTNSKFADGNTNTMYKIISEEMRGLSVETGIPIVSANQANRGGLNVSDLDLTDVADSIGQTMTADIIIGIMQTEEMNEQGLYSLKILKNRFGGKFSRTLVSVDYNKMRLVDGPDELDEFTDARAESTAVQAVDVLKDNLKFNRRERQNKIIEFD